MKATEEEKKKLLNEIVEKREKELENWKNVIGKNALFYTKDDKIKAAQFVGVLSSVLTDLKQLQSLYE